MRQCFAARKPRTVGPKMQTFRVFPGEDSQIGVASLAGAGRALYALVAMVLVASPATAQFQPLTVRDVGLPEPITVAPPAMPLAGPALTFSPPTLELGLPSATAIIRDVTADMLSATEATRIVSTIAGPPQLPSEIPDLGNGFTAGNILPGGLLAPGSETTGALVARIGSAARVDMPNLTLDFAGDGLLSFEIAPAILEISPDIEVRGGDALAGLNGQLVSLDARMADRVLDGMVNIEGIRPATTIEITNGSVVLGGQDPATHTGNKDDERPDKPGDNNDTPPADDPCQSGSLPCFTFDRSLPRLSTFQAPSSNDDLLDVSIVLPLRRPEPRGDQFTNYGNEELW